MKKKLLKTTLLKNWKKLLNFLTFQKTYKSKEKFPSAHRVSRCSENNRQIIIGKEIYLKTEKNEKMQKVKKKKFQFSPFFCHISQQKMILAHKTATNCYHNISQVEGASSIPI